MRVPTSARLAIVFAILCSSAAPHVVVADDTDDGHGSAAAKVWQPAEGDEQHLWGAWRMHEADLLLQTQGRREPWATDTEAAIAEYVATRYPDGGAILVRAQCGETFCRISAEFDNKVLRARFSGAVSSNTESDDWRMPEFLHQGMSAWNRPDGGLEMIVPASADSMPVIPPPTSRPPDSVLELFLGPADDATTE